MDNWYLAIICKIQPKNEQECIKINFLPYPKGNRDEWIGLNEIENRLSGTFTMVDQIDDKDNINKSFNSLREYSKKFITPSASQPAGKAASKQDKANDKSQQKGVQGKNTV